MSTETCSVCGAALAADARRCPNCGVEVSRTAEGDVAERDVGGRSAAEPAGEAAAGHGAGWYRAAFILLGFLFVASAIAVLHMELALR